MSGEDHFNGLDKSSSFLDHLYFTFTIQSTVGFGDIYPKSAIAKTVVMLQQSVLILEALELLSQADSSAPSVVPSVVLNAVKK
jgi:hypothetical protein